MTIQDTIEGRVPEALTTPLIDAEGRAVAAGADTTAQPGDGTDASGASTGSPSPGTRGTKPLGRDLQRGPIRRRTPPTALPKSGEEFQQRVGELHSWVWQVADLHQRLASRWSLLDQWTRLVAAITASLSALTLFADSRAATAVFAISAALASGLNAAWGPDKRVAQHVDAYRSYSGLLRPLSDLEMILHPDVQYVPVQAVDPVTHETFDAGYYTGSLSAAEVRGAWTELQRCEDALDKVIAKAPLLPQTFSRTPHTKFGVWRLERRLANEAKANRAYAAANGSDEAG